LKVEYINVVEIGVEDGWLVFHKEGVKRKSDIKIVDLCRILLLDKTILQEPSTNYMEGVCKTTKR
jgi:hypothetical protein